MTRFSYIVSCFQNTCTLKVNQCLSNDEVLSVVLNEIQLEPAPSVIGILYLFGFWMTMVRVRSWKEHY